MAGDVAMRIGASWYPEMWPEKEWAKDVRRMREIGFNMTRLFEFAWHRFEPEEGRYDFDWALRVMDLCQKAGIGVMAGTPTAAPPAWLTHKYPEVLRTNAEGRRTTHGRRQHASIHSAVYRDLCRRIVERMAEALSKHPALHSWQIDNEMAGWDFSAETREAFREWLRERYGTIEEMNRIWGLEFWSQAYSSFDQVPLPAFEGEGRKDAGEGHHSSLVLAALRFHNDAWDAFIRDQCAAIRAVSRKPITTNMVGNGLGSMNWFVLNRPLDCVGTSMYSDVAHYHMNMPHFDRMRAEKPGRPYGLLETAPNWSGGTRIWNIHNDGRGIGARTWSAIFPGGTMALYWQWREHWAGPEMLHGTVVTAQGGWQPNRDALGRLAAALKRHGPWLLRHPPQRADVAIVVSNEASWAFSLAPIDDGMEYATRWRDDAYLPVARSHIWRDVIHESADFRRYRVILIPYMPILAEDTKRRLAAWVRGGGRLLLGPLSGFRNEEFTMFRDREFGGLEDLIGAESALHFPAQWVEDTIRVSFADGSTARTRVWCHGFRPRSAKALATYRGGYGDGLAAVVRNRAGQGVVVTLGCMLGGDVYAQLARTLAEEAGVKPIAEGSGDVLVVPRARTNGRTAGYGLVNLAKEPREIALPAGGTDLLTGEGCGPAVRLDPLQARLVVAKPE